MLTPKQEHALLVEALAYALNNIAIAEHYEGSENMRVLVHILRRKISRDAFEELVGEAKNRIKAKGFKQSISAIHKSFGEKTEKTKEVLYGSQETRL